MQRITTLAVGIGWLLCIGVCSPPCISQQPVPSPQSASPVTVRLEAKDGQSHFFLGDPIELELVFTNPGSDPYTLNTTLSGDLSEKITISPATGWIQWRGPSGRDYSVASRLESKEIRFRVVLNDGFVFREPGHYEVSITISRLSQGAPLAPDTMDLSLTTNTVGLDLAARDPAEESSLVRTLSNQIASLPSSKNPYDDPRSEAANRLASLPGDDAVREKVRWLLDDSHDNQSISHAMSGGLPASRNLQLQLSLLQAAWNDPQRTPDSTLEEALALTRHFLSNPTMLPGWRMVVMPSSGKPDAAAQQAIDQHNSDIDYIIQSLPARAGDNRRNTAYFLIFSNLTPAQLAQVKPIAVEEFAHMDPLAQGMLLQTRWKQISDPALVPGIRAMLDKPPAEFVGYGDALERLIELDPVSAKPYVVREICDARSRIAIEYIQSLPVETLPETDACLLQQITALSGGNGPAGKIPWPEKLLIAARFSSAAIYLQMLALYHSHPEWNTPTYSAVQSDFVAYLNRWHPETTLQPLPLQHY
jgi:hypothetical protein